MRTIKDEKFVERLVYWVIWVVLLFLPLVFWDFSDLSQRYRIIGGWLRILPFLLIFILHDQLLLPKLFIDRKRVLYFTFTLLTILLINYLFIYGFSLHEWAFKTFGAPPSQMGVEGQHHGTALPISHDQSIYKPKMKGMGRGGFWHMPLYMIFSYNVIISFLIVGFNTSLKLASKWLKDEQKRKELEKENIRSKLTSLQQQVSPHFFMNTLNNIHALIDYSKKDAQDAVLRLSKMMRYLLYDSERGRTTLQKEIEFLNSYIDLMRIRLPELVTLDVKFPVKVPQCEIPPFLFLSFVENAFKYGINPRGQSSIIILLDISHNKAHFNIKNSIGAKPANGDDSTGIGIENTRKRMDLLFAENYTLNVYHRENEYEVDLTFPIYAD